ncbi:outer membrane protein assembly factor BamA [Phycisphaera mikurensis]|uniref:Outer membrane protein assembly factor BamA n=1 Tax=Phycisphaera mikurensis (strain NBRC 102666 / KCTC 22515 / FYK2301M01) TaxID=1142394 RepID=I0IC88_PHYMF|nr:outer membrane protein assembly factor BamA [Phycisphaera mikurensis]MBB6441905.1 outer membrane protein assembly complex protein YaeT [Phycisphaera mikurensis]BAM02876.1 hypothetical protein PSMK_07170 [Phycisphaera mikurensis NBRC 102666]
MNPTARAQRPDTPGGRAAGPGRRSGRLAGSLTLCLTLLAASPAPAGFAQEAADAWTDRAVVEVGFAGLETVSETLASNAVRMSPGDPYDAARVNDDIDRLTRLGRFRKVFAEVEPVAGGVRLVYRVEEQPLLEGVEIRGNKAVDDLTLRSAVTLRAGDPADEFLVERAVRQIGELYRKRGFFVADVSVDREALRRDRTLVLTIREGPKLRVHGIAFEGNEVFSDDELRKEVKQPTRIPVLRQGNLDRDLVELDAARVREYLRDRGHLDAQVGSRIDVSPDQQRAVVTFLVEEGARYTVKSVRFVPAGGAGAASPLLIPEEQLLLAMSLKPGSVFSVKKSVESGAAIEALYGRLGHLDAEARVERRFDPQRPEVALEVGVDPGEPAVVGKVDVRGNNLTRTRVVLRETRGLTPGRRFDAVGLEETRRRLSESALFAQPTVTILGEPGDAVRDVLIEVQERNTGSIAFGANVSSDLGLGGAIDLTQRNFDITDTPASLGDFVTGQSFRGAGQTFNLTASPGARNSSYAVSWRDPAFLESDFSLSLSAFFNDRDRREFDERRGGGSVGVGRRFGDVWSGAVVGRYNSIRIADIEEDAPVDVFAVEGDNDLTSLGLSFTRSTADSFFTPSRGSRTEFGVDQVGALGGSFEFTRLSAGFTKFWTVDQDYLDRRTIVSFGVDAGYILQENEAPVFERFYAGGRSFRGFDFRGIGPRGVRNDTGQVGDDAVGGRFSLLTTLQYEFPLVDRYLRGVVFTDQGTIDTSVDLGRWRVSVGAGIRMAIPFLSQAPFAIDFAVPLLDEEGDEDELISFTLDIPFQ